MARSDGWLLTEVMKLAPYCRQVCLELSVDYLTVVGYRQVSSNKMGFPSSFNSAIRNSPVSQVGSILQGGKRLRRGGESHPFSIHNLALANQQEKNRKLLFFWLSIVFTISHCSFLSLFTHHVLLLHLTESHKFARYFQNIPIQKHQIFTTMTSLTI